MVNYINYLQLFNNLGFGKYPRIDTRFICSMIVEYEEKV